MPPIICRPIARASPTPFSKTATPLAGPGICSDSDMYTFGYSFRPWQKNSSISDGESIRTYIRETAEAYGIDRHIRFRHRVKSASWSSADALWTVEVERGAEREPVRLRCNF